jgi:hypothetical protein
MKKLTQYSLFAVSVSLLSACASWVQLTAEGQVVRILDANQVSNCGRIGSASSQSMDEILFLDRNQQRLEDELRTLARNEGGRMGGNVIVAESDIVDGQQHFGVYSCP